MKETAFARDLGDRDFRSPASSSARRARAMRSIVRNCLGLTPDTSIKLRSRVLTLAPTWRHNCVTWMGRERCALKNSWVRITSPQLLAPGSAFPGDVPVGGWQDGGERGGQALLTTRPAATGSRMLRSRRSRARSISTASVMAAETCRRLADPEVGIQLPRFQIHPHRFKSSALDLKTHPASPRREAAVKLGVFRQGERHRTAKRYTNHIPGIGFRLNETEHDTIRRHRADDKNRKVIGAIVESAVAELGVQDLTGKASGLDLDISNDPPLTASSSSFGWNESSASLRIAGDEEMRVVQKLTFAGGDPTIQILDGIHGNPGNHGEFFQHVHVRYPRGGDFMTTTPLLLLELSVALIILATGMDSTPRDMASLPGPRTAVITACTS